MYYAYNLYIEVKKQHKHKNIIVHKNNRKHSRSYNRNNKNNTEKKNI